MNFSSVIENARLTKIVLAVTSLGCILLFGWFWFKLPDPSVFNQNVERIFVETDLTSQAEIKLLEVLASSGTLFESALNLHLQIILTLMLLSFALVLISAGLLLSNLNMRQQYKEMRSRALNPSSISLFRDQNQVRINDDNFTLTKSNIETLALFMEARLDSEYLTGTEVEAMISGKPLAECEEAAGVVRIKRLRDALGNQIISELMLRNIPGKGYLLDIPQDKINLS